MKLRHVLVFSLSLLLTSWAASVHAQQGAMSSLGGRVVDPQGVAVAGAKVTIVQKATGLSREASTNAGGHFRLTDLAPGEYEVRALASGFAETVFPSVSLAVGRTVELAVALKVGGREENVTVEGTPLVNTTSAVVDGLITADEIRDLPLNGRNFLELSFLVPGNSPAPNFDPTKSNTVLVSSAGQLGRGANVTIDGADINDDAVGGSVQNISEEAVQEFQIATNRFSAELGRTGSAVTNVITKSGTNATHGSLSVFLRDHAWQALPATYDRTNSEVPPFSRQQYAFGLGGPLVKDKLFWFASAEYRDQNGGVLVGSRDLATRTIDKSFAPAPLRDTMATGRLDWIPSSADRVTFRYAFQHAADTGASTLDRAIGSSSYRQQSTNEGHSGLASWTHMLSPSSTNSLLLAVSDFDNSTVPTTPGIQLTFPSILDGASFRVPQATHQRRYQLDDTLSFLVGNHSLKVGAEVQKISADFGLGVFRQGRIEFVQDFPQFDLNGDGRVDDNDLLFAVTLRSNKPDQDLNLDNQDNTHVAGFVQDDWRIHPQFTLNAGLRYEVDTDVKNVSGYDQVNPIAKPFYVGDRKRDGNNFGPRVGFNWASKDGRMSVHGGYGIYYDRVTLEIVSLERGLDGRSLVVEVRAGNVFFLGPQGPTPGAPTYQNPFTGFILPGAGASGIDIIDNRLQNPTVQQFNFGAQRQIGKDFVMKADYVHNLGTHFIIGRPLGTVFNPVVGGPDTIVNLESSVNTHYDALLFSAEKRFSKGSQLRVAYTLAKALNYANDDQIPFSYGPVDPNNLRLEYGPTPNDQRHRVSAAGTFTLPAGFSVSPIFTFATGVPMDIQMPDGSSRVPAFQRNAGGRQFKTGAELNAFIVKLNASGGVKGTLLPLVSNDAQFSDNFQSFDMRLAKAFRLGPKSSVELIAEVFNLFNVTNILGVSTSNYSGFSNVLVRDSDDPTNPGYLKSSSFGKPVTTAGGIFGSGGPRAFQFGARIAF
ncbi:MAG: carboxypeptidase regulatory-like domain-containing protein [Vicinamibacteria bacterium]